MQNQKKVWEEIAPEWNEFKKIPAKTTQEFLKNKTGKILDLGSGSGRNLQKIKNGKMYLLDFSKEMIKLAEEKAKQKKIPAEFFVSEMNNLPFKENFFDAVICISSLHCLPKNQHKKTVKELYRVLKPKSQALIGVWNKDSKRFKNAEKEKLVRWRDKGQRYYYLFEEKEVHDLFKQIGFKILESKNSEMMINFIVEKE